MRKAPRRGLGHALLVAADQKEKIAMIGQVVSHYKILQKLG
jgi:hypothetical protein